MSGVSNQPRGWRIHSRLNLRAFLGAITILCLLIGWRMERARLQHDAVEAIRAAGNGAYYDYQLEPSGRYHTYAKPWEPDWLLGIVGDDFLHDVICQGNRI
jgi:hypothetical protein